MMASMATAANSENVDMASSLSLNVVEQCSDRTVVSNKSSPSDDNSSVSRPSLSFSFSSIVNLRKISHP